MGTAVLLPQDCLRTSKSKHKPNFSDLLYGSSSLSRGGEGDFHVLDPRAFHTDQSRQKPNSTKRVGLSAKPGTLPLSEQGQVFAKTNLVQREADCRRLKARKPVEARVGKFALKSGPDVPVFTILQRPKDKVAANELIAKFLIKVDEAKPTIGLIESKSDMKVNECKLGIGTENVNVKNGISNFKKGMAVPAVEQAKLLGSILSTKVDWQAKDFKQEKGKLHSSIQGSSKAVKSGGYNRFDDLLSAKGLNQMLSPYVTGELKSLQTAGAAENFSCKLAHVNRSNRVDNRTDGGVARLRRASTDPQIVKQLVGQHRSEVMEIPHSGARSLHGITRSSSMSCPERWAGPAYSSSPAPSSLPLPKFTLLNQKISSSNISSRLVEGSKTMLTQLPKSGSVHTPNLGVLQGGELDVDSATRSLRRMLKLEPL